MFVALERESGIIRVSPGGGDEPEFQRPSRFFGDRGPAVI